MSCTAVVERIDAFTGKVTITPPAGVTILAPFVLPTGIQCQVYATLTIGVFSINFISDIAYFWFADNAFTVQDSYGNIFYIGVGNATRESPLQVPLPCIACDNTQITAGARTRLIKGRATAGGSGTGPDVRVVARRRWGDDFAGCNVCNH
jgi:hypothetical protein